MHYKNKIKITSDKIFWTYIKGILISSMVFVFFLIAVAILITYTSLSESIIPITTTILLIVTAIINGIYVAGRRKRKGWLNGMLSGCLYFVVIIFFSWVFASGFALKISLIYKGVIILASSSVGGMIGVNLNK